MVYVEDVSLWESRRCGGGGVMLWRLWGLMGCCDKSGYMDEYCYDSVAVDPSWRLFCMVAAMNAHDHACVILSLVRWMTASDRGAVAVMSRRIFIFVNLLRSNPSLPSLP